MVLTISGKKTAPGSQSRLMHEFLPGKVHPVLQQKILCRLKRDNLKRGYQLTVNWVWDDQALARTAVQPTSTGLGCAPGDTCRCVRRSR